MKYRCIDTRGINNISIVNTGQCTCTEHGKQKLSRACLTCGNTPLSVSADQALYVNPTDCYSIHRPICRGYLNTHSGPGGSLSATLADLETIWSHAVQKLLEIPLKDLKVHEEQVSFHWHMGLNQGWLDTIALVSVRYQNVIPQYRY